MLLLTVKAFLSFLFAVLIFDAFGYWTQLKTRDWKLLDHIVHCLRSYVFFLGIPLRRALHTGLLNQGLLLSLKDAGSYTTSYTFAVR
uniref:Uncharacterized protein n=1 Tax=Medicago truncatula TaxID=3880 RepID=I3SAC4_MEDTR|nr:unknown [Medicago truncatula]